MNVDFRKDRIAAVQAVLASIIASQRALRVLAPEYGRQGLGNLLGDFGELVAIDHYGLQRATAGSGEYDARTVDGKSVQIKTNRAASQIGFRGDPELLLVRRVADDGSWEEVYFGPFAPVKGASRFSSRDNKHMIAVAKLRLMAPARADALVASCDKDLL